jgi:protein SCO1/2
MKALAILVVLGSACVQEREPPAAPAPQAEPTPIAPALDEPSIYELDLSLRTADNRDVGVDVERGHPVLISMFYASCPVACPVLIADIGRIVTELPPEVQRDVRVVLVSFDPRDTPDRLAELATERKLDERWTLVSANESDARTLAAILGFKFRRLANGEYMHGSTIVALDVEGRPLARTEQLGQHAAILSALR